jgi:O-antigen ligase
MPPSAALDGSTLESRSRKIVQNEIGYSRVNMSMMLSGASWAVLATLPLLRRRWHKVAVVLAALAVAYGQALTGGRMGYVTWMIVGVILCGLRWRKLLLLAPFVVVAIALALPGTVERMMQGFGATGSMGEEYTDDYEVTAGRTLIWPYVIDKIAEAPVLGHGRLAMVRTGLRNHLLIEYGEHFPHPHNAYLECLLDNGALGFICIIPFYALLVFYCARQFRDKRDPWRAAIGGVTLALLLALLVASLGSQTFYPREGAVCMWAAIALSLRLVVLRQQQPVMAPSMRPEARIPLGYAAALHGR